MKCIFKLYFICTFSVVERVLQNHRNAPLTMNDVRLSVSALRPAPISPRLIGEAESDKLLVTNIPEDASTDDLRRYIQRGSGALVTKLRYSMKPGVAMIQFQDTFGEAHVDIVSEHLYSTGQGDKQIRGALCFDPYVTHLTQTRHMSQHALGRQWPKCDNP